MEFRIGGQEEIQKAIEDGYRVGLIVKIKDPFDQHSDGEYHMFHIGLENTGNLTDISDAPDPNERNNK